MPCAPRIEVEVQVVIKAVVAKMAFPYHGLHQNTAVVLRAVGVQHVGIGLVMLLHVLVVR